LFGISRQSIYQSKLRHEVRQKELLQLKPLVQQLRMEMPRLGTRKLYYLLKPQFEELSIKIGRDAFFDYLRHENMLILPKRQYTKTTNSKHWLKKHPNLLKQVKPDRPEQVFVSDITFIKTRDKTHYLSLITDAYSRKIMGYQLSDDMNTANMVQALKMAIKHRITNYPLIHHSDRGLQYCSSMYQLELSNNQIIPSMTDGYDCYQNALAERINGILKQEFLIYTCNNSVELKQLIQESVRIYNSKRPHLSLNMKTPNFIHEKTEADICFG
jgi:transposase InsO family protein